MTRSEPPPAGGQKPSAPAVAHSEIFREMRAEVAKLESTSATVDWSRVRALSQHVLSGDGQDLLAAAYLAHARHEVEGVPAVAPGLTQLANLLDAGWANLQPPPTRLRARLGAVQWYLDRTATKLAHVPQGADRERVAVQAALLALQRICKERFGPQALAFSPVAQCIAAWPATAAPASAPAPAPAVPAAPRASPAKSIVTGPEAVARPGLIALGAELCAIAAARRAAAAHDASAYRLLRVGLWLHLDEPPTLINGRSRIAPLPTALAAELDNLAQQQRWLELVACCEQAALSNRLNLRLQRMCAEALSQLGPTFVLCQQAVASAVQDLLARLPSLPELQASDLQPLQDEATRRWLRALQAGAPPRAANVGGEHAARPLPKTKRADGRRRFVRRLSFAEQAFAAGHVQVARAILAGLRRDARRHRLAAWDGALCQRLLHTQLQVLEATPQAAQQASRAFAELARLNPRAAIAWTKR